MSDGAATAEASEAAGETANSVEQYEGGSSDDEWENQNETAASE